MANRILGVRGEPNDLARKESFLGFNPSAREIREFLKAPRPQHSLVHQCFYASAGQSHVASYVLATKEREICLTVMGTVTHAQADEIDRRLDYIARVSLPPFQDVVEAVLDESVNGAQSKGVYIAKWWREK
jgi:hypothetical protein